jgi:tetratricopeptide (TPR) repeat protein
MSRRGWRRCLAAGTGVVAALFALSWSPELRADPSFWARVRDPRLERARRTLEAAERMLFFANEIRADRAARDFQLAAVAMLELGGARELPDPRLRYFLGKQLVAVNRSREGRELLERFLQEAPDSPLAADAWYEIAIASAKLDDREREHEAYTRCLEVQHEPEFRSTLLMNRAESKMMRGELRAAISGYQHALRITPSPITQSLSLWGMGVAQERNGDLPSALVTLRLALGIKLPRSAFAAQSALDLPNVFFVPEYEIYYYKGLGALAEAQGKKTPKLDLQRALAHFDAYIEQAEPAKERWLDNARRLRARAQSDLLQWERQAGKKPPPSEKPPPEEPED